MELDAAVAEVAKSHFEFIEDERMKVYVEDGLEYVSRLAEGNKTTLYAIAS